MHAGDNYLSKLFKEYIQKNEPNNPVVTCSAELEFEASMYKNDGKTPEEKRRVFNEFFEAYGCKGSMLNELLKVCSDHLNIQKFYTAGQDCVSSWIIQKGDTALTAAGKIHTDFQK